MENSADTQNWDDFINTLFPPLDPHLELDPGFYLSADDVQADPNASGSPYVAKTDDLENDAKTTNSLDEYLGSTSNSRSSVSRVTAKPESFDPLRATASQSLTLFETSLQLESEMQEIRQTIDQHREMIEEAKQSIEEATQKVATLKTVYDQLTPWSLKMQDAVSDLARRSGLTELRE